MEDELAISEDLRDIVEEAGHTVVGVAPTFARACSILANEEADIALLDIALKGEGSGLDVARHINEQYSIPFVFLTSFADQDTVTDVVALEPAGYIVKPFKEQDIAPAIAVALSTRHNRQSSFPSTQKINGHLADDLSSQEYVVLQQLCKGKTNQAIADDLFISVNTVKTHVKRIYHKFDVHGRVQLLNRVVELKK